MIYDGIVTSLDCQCRHDFTISLSREPTLGIGVGLHNYIQTDSQSLQFFTTLTNINIMASIKVVVAGSEHIGYAEEVCQLIEISASQRGTGIAKRDPEYIKQKMQEHKAIIALAGKEIAGFCYIETWSDKSYVANSGLIVSHKYRGEGLAKKIKKKAFEHSQTMFPSARLFGLTTSLAVMKINSDLGYQPVTYNQLTADEAFWKGCSSCVNYEILKSKEKTNCICTAMLYDASKKKKQKWEFLKNSKIYERFLRLKQSKLINKKSNEESIIGI